MNRSRGQESRNFRVVFTALLSLFLAHATECCWGETAPKYGDMTDDYDLLVDEDLVLNCTLNEYYIHVSRTGLPDAKVYVNSSYLTFRKGTRIPPRFVHRLDGLTSQLRIPKARSEDAGIYYCELAIPELSGEPLVCSSKVSIGTPPKAVKNFSCISKYYENLTCSWDADDTGVQTSYTLYKHHYLFSYWVNIQLQQCPPETANNSYCQWSKDTDPPFDYKEKAFTFLLRGQNSLGVHNDTFNISHYEILLPNHPQALQVVSVQRQSISLQWTPPNKMTIAEGPPLQYELWVQEMSGETKERKIIDVGINTSSYTVSDLIPHMMYNISLHCRSKFAPSTLWSPFTSVTNQTLPDVPYHVPEIIPEAFELHHYDGYRSVTLYWKPVLKKHFNGEMFKYHIVYSANDTTSGNISASNTNTSLSGMRSVNATMLFATFDHLRKDLAYAFFLYSMNEKGLSESYQRIVVDRQENIPNLPEEITAISHDPGHYELTWKPPKKNPASIVNYVVLWCSSLKPWLSRCEGPIQWLNATSSQALEQNKITLNLSDTSTNFQFAVVARSENSYSGMEWATCIVPYKAALGKVPYVIVEPKNSTSLKVIWHLDCPAQKAVVKKFEIVYCKTDGSKQCVGNKQSVDVMKPEAENYELQNLHPFSNYRVIVRAFNLAGVASEDSDVKFQSTLQGAPTDSPRDVKARPKPNATIHVTWRPPMQPNGIVTEYMINYQDRLVTVKVEGQQEYYERDITGLLYYTDYSIKVRACVKNDCSPSSSPVFVRTDIGVPSAMEPPRVEALNSTFIKVSWNQPSSPNGPIDFYEIHWMEIKAINSTDEDKPERKVVLSGFSTVIELSCLNVKNGVVKYFFVVRAANNKDGQALYGPFSAPTQAQACLMTPGVAMVIGVAIGGTLVLAFLMLLIYKLIKWMSDKIHQLKSITVKLPKGLDGPEANPLSNYDSLKHSIVQPSLTSTSLAKIPYLIDESDKNRHGSGSSQYSYSSTDELLYRNGKVTKFVRKQSGESSGCSSMSSNMTRNHMSSESSAESDFMMPPSPDILPEPVSSTCRKSMLPIVLEAQDNPISDSSSEQTPTKLVSFKPRGKFGANMNEIVLKIEQPYSKFGYSGYTTAIPTWWTNSFALYSTNLSNSEPSMIDAQDNTETGIPYSKIGLAKSSGNILGLKTIDMELGYSKFGFVPSFRNSGQKTLGTNKLPNGFVDHAGKLDQSVLGYQNANHNVLSLPNGMMSSSGPWPKRMPYTLLEKGSNGLREESGYIRFAKSNGNNGLTGTSGYVPFKELSTISRNVEQSYPVVNTEVQEDSDTELSMSDVLQGLQIIKPPNDSTLVLNNAIPTIESDLHEVDKNERMNYSHIPKIPIDFPPDPETSHDKNVKSTSIPVSPVEGSLPARKLSNVLQGTVTDKVISTLDDSHTDANLVVKEAKPGKVQGSNATLTNHLPPTKTVSSVNVDANLTNGYVPFAAFTNLANDSRPCVPNATIPDSANTSECLVSRECDSHSDVRVVNDRKPVSDCFNNLVPCGTMNSNCSLTKPKVLSILDNISKCKYSQPFDDDESVCEKQVNKSVKNKSSDHFITFAPPVESEICEV